MNESPVDSQSRGKALPAGKEIPSSAPKKSYHFDTTFFIQTAGLEYHKKALKKIREITGFEDEEFLSCNMELISGFSYSENDKKEIDLYLTQAKLAFEQATASSKTTFFGRAIFHSTLQELKFSPIL